MISFGLDFATDLPVDAAAALKADAAMDQQGANLFDAVLGQLIGSPDGEFVDAANDDVKSQPDDREEGNEPVVDLSELVNPFLTLQLVPGTNFNSPSQLVPGTDCAPQLVPGTNFNAVVAEVAKSEQLLPENGETTIGPASLELPIDLVSALEAAEAASEAEPELRPLPTSPGPPADLERPQQDGKENSSIPPQAASDVASAKNDPIVAEIANIANKADRPERPAKNTKPRTEPKIEVPVERAIPFQAVERAYASGDRESAKSFDQPRDAAPMPRLQSTGQPSAAPAFVVPVDARPSLAAPAPAMTLAVDTPQHIDNAIETHVPAQIVQSIRMQAIDGGGEAIVRLRPDYLGEVVVAVKVDRGSVTAALQADTPAVRQWVERNENVLRQALAEQGLQLDRLTVSEKASEPEMQRQPDRRQQTREEPQRQQPRRRRQPADEATFEVTV